MESQIYNVTVDVFNQITSNQYKNDQDKIYVAAEKLFIGYKNVKKDDIEVIRSALKIFYKSVDNNKCMEFKELLYQELSKDDYGSLYREIRLLQEEQESKKTSRIEQKVDQISQKMDETQKDDEEIVITQNNGEKFHNNKKQDYIKIWNSRLFLHMDNDERPITLADAFIMPDYEKYIEVKRIGFSDKDTLDKVIEKFIDYEKTSSMLITGVPGMGKTTITSWIAYTYNDDDRFIILRFRDWDIDELEYGILKSICNTLECKKKDLENKILVLDGFDEMKALDICDDLLDSFFDDIKDFENFKCILTSRPDYINSNRFENVLRLKVFDINKVETFYKIISEKGIDKKDKIESNLDVLGIPVILYMAIMSKIDICENPTKPELYNQIFAESEGIFDRFYNGEVEYSAGTHILRNPENIKKYLSFLQEVAFKMFEKNNLYLREGEYFVPELEFQRKTVSVLEFPIKHLFEYTESNIEFIHKSIYEYFMSEYIISSMNEAINVSKEELASVFGYLLKNNALSEEILEFMNFKIRNSKLNDMFDYIYEVFLLMLHDGMTYYAKERYKNIIECEMCIFANMLEIIHLWDGSYLKFDELLVRYLRYNRNHPLNLKNTILRLEKENSVNEVLDLSKGVYLGGVDLSGGNLSGIDLREAFLRRANLERANLKGANLERASLRKANLKEADLERANLRKADLRSADLRKANLKLANIESSIWFEFEVKKSIKQLKEAYFNTLCIIVNNRGKITPRSELLPDKNN